MTSGGDGQRAGVLTEVLLLFIKNEIDEQNKINRSKVCKKRDFSREVEMLLFRGAFFSGNFILLTIKIIFLRESFEFDVFKERFRFGMREWLGRYLYLYIFL